MDWFSPVDLYSPIQASNPKLNSAAPSNSPVSEFRSTSGNDSINSISAAKILKLFELHKDFEENSTCSILEHMGNAYKEGELDIEATCKEYLTVQQEGKRKVTRKVKYYDLDVIISVGYRNACRTAFQFVKFPVSINGTKLKSCHPSSEAIPLRSNGSTSPRRVAAKVRKNSEIA